jgi:hypothetical protein
VRGYVYRSILEQGVRNILPLMPLVIASSLGSASREQTVKLPAGRTANNNPNRPILNLCMDAPRDRQ